MTKRNRRSRTDRLLERQKAWLLTGRDWRYLGPELGPDGPDTMPYESEAEARAAWLAHRDELLAEWIGREPYRSGDGTEMRGGPGTRPWAWWRWEATAPRHHTADAARLAELRAVGWGTEAVWRWEFGKPYGGYVEHEPERAYLSRHGLFLEGEEDMLSPSPQVVE